MRDGNYLPGQTKGKLQHYYSKLMFTFCKKEFVSVDVVHDIQLTFHLEKVRLG